MQRFVLEGHPGFEARGQSARLPPMWWGSIPGPGVICGLSLLLVFALLRSRVFLRVLPKRFGANGVGFRVKRRFDVLYVQHLVD